MKFDKYVGLPYKDNGRDTTGIDCWGLVRLYYKDELGIDLPSYTDEYEGPFDTNVARAINHYKDNWEQTTTPGVGDIVLFNIYGEPAHVGVYVGNNKFLHSREGKDSVIESLAGVQWNKRLAGIYKYTEQAQVQVMGAPHPLKTNIYREWTVAGTTVQDFVNFATEKYKVSTRVASQLKIVIDGIPVPKEQWSTTVIQAGQTIAYRATPEGGDTLRMLLIIAIAFAAPYLATTGFTALGVSIPGLGFVAGTWQATAAALAISFTGMALVNAIMPVRPPTVNDPGSPGALNLFTGSSNQANKFGPIPVVLGKVRITGALGASPYIETLTDTTLLNLLVVWGFGPLAITDICIGSNPIDNYYEGFSIDTPKPVTLYGRPEEDQTSFNKLYGSDVEQAPAKQVELVNNATDGNPWQYIYFNQESTRVDVSFNCPEGMRTINTKNGNVSAATASVEVQLGTYTNGSWNFDDTATYFNGTYSTNVPNAAAYKTTLQPAGYSDYTGDYISLYRYTIFALVPGGGIQRFDGAATDSQFSEPSITLTNIYKEGSYTTLVGNDTNYKRLPQLPPSYQKLYTVCILGSTGVISTQSHLTDYAGSTGLGLTSTAVAEIYDDGQGSTSERNTGSTLISIQAGTIFNSTETAIQIANYTPIEVFNSREFSGVNTANYGGWCQFLNDYAVQSNTDTLNVTKNVSFPYTGYYNIEASADDEGEVSIDGKKILTMPSPAYKGTITALEYFEAGSYAINLKGTNSGGGLKGAAVRVTYTKSGLNTTATKHTEIVFGTAGFFEKRKDPFSFCQRFLQLPKARYAIRCKRTTSDIAEEGDYHKYSKIVLFTAACFNNTNPAVNPPGCYLAKTAIRVQSTNKANGTVDGVNAMVESIALDWDKAAQKWITRPTNNPASLFQYVLMHPGNAYKITEQNRTAKIDTASLQEWHEFCEGSNPSSNRLTYNNIITGSMSVMDVLRDICAAGMASPLFINGKWSIVVDKPRAYTAQYFTTYNSWGFESTKALPRLPHAFKVTIPDETSAYQPMEYIVYNYGYNATGTGGKLQATLFESLSLPGITNPDQAKFLAKWNLAQLTLRPEIYTLNTDFEYLVCGRGDVVKVTHDVPMWGLGSGRLKTATTGATSLVLSEEMFLTAGKNYQILIRVNSKNNPNGITKNIDTIATTGWYGTILLKSDSTITSGDGIEVDNLFMLGEAQKVTQELVVLSVEPTNNTGAKLTLVDYSPQIYTANLDDLQTFDANITMASNQIVQNTITQAPVVVQVTSSSALSEAISGGTYQNVVLVSFSNPSDLTNQAQVIEVQAVAADSDFGSTSLAGLYKVDKQVGSLVINGLTTGNMYKLRARYTNQLGSISGPWSDTTYFTNLGKNTNYYTAPTLVMDLDGTEVIARPSNTIKPSDFKHYEYRIYKDTGSEDFWELPVVGKTNTTAEATLAATYNIQYMTTTNEGRFDLTKQTIPRISNSGVTYRVACRAVDNTGNYSEASTLGTIVVKTIQ
jgi:hypothetical protein